MEFHRRFAGSSIVTQRDAATELAFAPDTLREPTYFRGKVEKQVEFREAMSALHDVVIADQRFNPKDRTAYLAWREQQSMVDLGDLMRDQASLRSDIDRVSTELSSLLTASRVRMAPFYAARSKYFDYLYQKDRELWFKLDPIITVHPDQVFFECFSRDESSYGRLAASYNVFSLLGERANGTTNIDYSEALYGEFQKIRSYKETTLDIDPTGFSVSTSMEDEYREVKIAVPDSWVRGFLQVSSAMTMPAHVIAMHPMDVHNICLTLRRNKEMFGPRSLRFKLSPGAPVSVKVDPWDKVIACPRSRCLGNSTTEIRMWGRRRLHVLERLLPLAKSVKLLLLGSGLPSFWVVDLGELSFTLGLSGWTNNNWSAAGNFDLLAAREQVDEVSQQAVFTALSKVWRASPSDLVQATGLSSPVIASALQGWTQCGRAMFDLEQGVYRKRELSGDPLPMSALRYSNPQEEAAAQILHTGKVAVDRADESSGGLVLNGRVQHNRRTMACKIAFDAERRISNAECECDYFIRNRLYRGPCEHMLALRAAHRRGVSDHVPEVSRAAVESVGLIRTSLQRIMGVRASGKIDQALRELRALEGQAAAGSEELLNVRELMAEALFDLGKDSDALALANQILRVRPASMIALRVATESACELKEYAAAMQTAHRLAENEGNADRWLSLLQIAGLAGDTASAERFVAAALVALPNNAQLQREQERIMSRVVVPETKKVSWFRKVINAVTGKGRPSTDAPDSPESSEAAMNRRLDAAVSALSQCATVSSPATLRSALSVAYRGAATDNERLFAWVEVAKQLCRDLPSDQQVIEQLRGALS